MKYTAPKFGLDSFVTLAQYPIYACIEGHANPHTHTHTHITKDSKHPNMGFRDRVVHT